VLSGIQYGDRIEGCQEKNSNMRKIIQIRVSFPRKQRILAQRTRLSMLELIISLEYAKMTALLDYRIRDI